MCDGAIVGQIILCTPILRMSLTATSEQIPIRHIVQYCNIINNNHNKCNNRLDLRGFIRVGPVPFREIYRTDGDGVVPRITRRIYYYLFIGGCMRISIT